MFRLRALVAGSLLAGVALSACSKPEDPEQHAAAAPDFEAEVAEYIRLFPYQDTYEYLLRYTGGDPAIMNS